MRGSIVMDTDGSSEYQKVRLTPSNWCVLCPFLPILMLFTETVRSGHGWPSRRQMRFKSQEGGESIEYLTSEIGRLRKMNRMITALKAVSTLTILWVIDLN